MDTTSPGNSDANTNTDEHTCSPDSNVNTLTNADIYMDTAAAAHFAGFNARHAAGNAACIGWRESPDKYPRC